MFWKVAGPIAYQFPNLQGFPNYCINVLHIIVF